MKVVAIDAIPFEIPYHRAFQFASGEVAKADHVLVRVRTDEGLVGHAEALPRPYTYGESQESIVAAIGNWFAPRIIGVDPLAREAVQKALDLTVANHTAKGAVDVAIWDIVGQALRQPCHVLLGGWATSVRVAHMVGFDTPSRMVDEALSVNGQYGVTSFKVKVGRRPWSLDIEVCQALRVALPDDVELYVDANRGWVPEDAVAAARALYELNVTQIEEPCPNDGVLGRRRVAKLSPVPIVGDESCDGLSEVARNLLDGLSHAISVKVARTGFSKSQRILALCEALGTGVRVGSQVEGMLGAAASVAFAVAHESTTVQPAELTAFMLMADDLLTEPQMIVDGHIAVSERPGLGVDLDEEKLDHYRIDH
ncbi:MAG: enolase C-terminal domain-like protein [Bacteroidota bacterium]